MAQDNVELVRRGIDAFNERDLDALLAMADPDVVTGSLLADMEGDYHGHAGVRRWWNSLLEILPDFTIEVVDIEDRGDVTVTRVRNHASAGSDAQVEQRLWIVAHWRAGKILESRSCRTEAEVEAAAAARP